MASTKKKIAAALGGILLLASITAFVSLSEPPPASPLPLPAPAKSVAELPQPTAATPSLVDQINRANFGLPGPQVQAKTLIFSVITQRQIPAAAQWCDALNRGGTLWAATPANINFALNAQMAGRPYSRKLPGDVVVFFETAQPGWNLSGGPELLANKPAGVAVAFADGRAVLVPDRDVPKLRWSPER